MRAKSSRMLCLDAPGQTNSSQRRPWPWLWMPSSKIHQVTARKGVLAGLSIGVVGCFLWQVIIVYLKGVVGCKRLRLILLKTVVSSARWRRNGLHCSICLSQVTDSNLYEGPNKDKWQFAWCLQSLERLQRVDLVHYQTTEEVGLPGLLALATHVMAQIPIFSLPCTYFGLNICGKHQKTKRQWWPAFLTSEAQVTFNQSWHALILSAFASLDPSTATHCLR